jgi:primosomal protein N'
MVQLLVRDSDRVKAETAARKIAVALSKDPVAREVRMAGPAPAPFERLRNQWRYQMLLRHPSTKVLHGLLDRALPDKVDADLVVDVDPYDLL